MKYSTGRKKRSRLQGHRKRRKSPGPGLEEQNAKLSWTEYKTIRQYQTMGDILDILMTVGFDGIVEEQVEIFKDHKQSTSNGYFWLTRDPP